MGLVHEGRTLDPELPALLMHPERPVHQRARAAHSWRPAGPCQQAVRPEERAQAVAEPDQATRLQNVAADSWRLVTTSQGWELQQAATGLLR